MRARFELTEGRHALREIVETFPPDSAHWNEAQNRFGFVDRLLTECLGWDRADIRVERSDAAGGKADYILGDPAKAVLEVKREAKDFGNLPTGKPTSVRSLQTLFAGSKNFEDACAQVIQYCVFQGAQIATVCNGPQLAVFQALTPGFPPTEGECFFFDGFKTYIEHFPLLWSLLSPEGISENRAYRQLALHRTPRIPQKASDYFADPFRLRYRSDFQESLRALSSILLEEIEDNPDLKADFYSECYVSMEANNRHLLLSKKMIGSRYNRVSDGGTLPTALAGTAEATPEGQLRISDPALSSGASSRPIVVIGDVGVGKTSFFENLEQHINTDDGSETYFIHINLGLRANLAADVKSFILSEIPNVLSARYGVDIFESDFVKSIYYNEIQAFDRGIHGKIREIDPDKYEIRKINYLDELVSRRDTHLFASLGHLAKGRQKQIVLIIDNADQRTFEVQQEAFLIAQELAATRNVIVFVALRPSTFYQSKTTGALSGYQNRLLTVSPPPADQVVERRIAFALRVAEGKVAPSTLAGIRLQLRSVVLFLTATLRSIRRNEEIQTFLSNITGGNTRGVIELITSFVGSPNVDSRKIVELEERQGRYVVPLHEFTKHALLGEYAYFNAHSSLLACNIFDVSAADPREHFLPSLIVAYLSSNIGIRDNDGFIGGEAILLEMRRHGYTDDQTRHSLRRLATKRLIETPHAHFRELEVPEHELEEQFYFRATSVGIYHIRHWTGSFSFLDAVSTDTPIFDESKRDRVFKIAESWAIRDRLEKTRTFKLYLEEQWQAAGVSASYYDFMELLRLGEKSFDAVSRRVNGPATPRRFASRSRQTH